MNDNIKKLLKAAGYKSEVIKAVSGDTLPDDFKIEDSITELEDSNKSRYFELFKNDDGEESFKAQIIKENSGKWTKTLNNDLKKLGVSLEDIQDLPVHEKLKFTADFIKTQAEEKLGTKNKDVSKEVEELQAKLLESENKITEIETERETAVTEAKTEAEKMITTFKVNSELKTLFSDIPAERLITKKHADGIWKAVNSTLTAQYDPILSESGELGFNIKGKSEKPTGKNADGQNVILGPKDVITNVVKDLGFWVESNGGGGAGDGGAPIVPPNDGGTLTPQAQKLQETMNKFKPVSV